MRTQRQQELLLAAMEIVAEQGFSRLTIRNVAAAIGVTEPAVYRHFPSKLALLTAILEELQKAIVPHFRALAYGKASLEELLRHFILGIFTELEKRPAYAPFIFSEEAFHNEPRLKDELNRMMKENLDILTRAFTLLRDRGICRKDVPPEQLGLVTMGTIRMSISCRHMDNSISGSGLIHSAESLVSTLAALLG